MLLIPRDDQAVFWVRKSYDRALNESLFQPIKPMDSFRDAQHSVSAAGKTVFLETEKVTLALYKRFQKYFPFSQIKSLDKQVSYVRSIKSSYELELMKKSGKIHQKVLEECVPEILIEGMSEADLATSLFHRF
jgi:Xaa-Pro dipeptidase